MAFRSTTERAAPAPLPDRLDALVDLPGSGTRPGAPRAGETTLPPDPVCLLGECLDAAHPTLKGRVLVRWAEAGGERRRWVPTLLNLPVRAADRVLLLRPANHDEPVVVGVLDGFARRPEAPRTPAARLALQRDEAVRVEGADGQPLAELFQTDAGPVVRLLHEDVNIELPGALRLKASQIELKAGAGSVEIEASDEVNVRGEVVNLN